MPPPPAPSWRAGPPARPFPFRLVHGSRRHCCEGSASTAPTSRFVNGFFCDRGTLLFSYSALKCNAIQLLKPVFLEPTVHRCADGRDCLPTGPFDVAQAAGALAARCTPVDTFSTPPSEHTILPETMLPEAKTRPLAHRRRHHNRTRPCGERVPSRGNAPAATLVLLTRGLPPTVARFAQPGKK